MKIEINRNDVAKIVSDGISLGPSPMSVTIKHSGKFLSRWFVCGPNTLHMVIGYDKVSKPIFDIEKLMAP